MVAEQEDPEALSSQTKASQSTVCVGEATLIAEEVQVASAPLLATDEVQIVVAEQVPAPLTPAVIVSPVPQTVKHYWSPLSSTAVAA